MSAILVINDDEKVPHNSLMWMPNSYNFATTLKHIIEVGKIINPAISQELKEFKDAPVSYVDITSWGKEKVKALFELTILAEKKLRNHRLNLNKANLAIMVIHSLKVQLLFDERVTSEKQVLQTGTVRIDDALVWQKPVWIYEFVLNAILDEIANFITKYKIEPMHNLMDTVSQAFETMSFDMKSLDVSEHKVLVVGIGILNTFYNMDGDGYELFPTQSIAFLKPVVAELYASYKQAYPAIVAWWETGEE